MLGNLNTFTSTDALRSHGVLLGIVGGRITATPYGEVVGAVKPLDPDLLRLARILTL